MDYDKYANYQLGDFLEDDSFVQWIINPDTENEIQWKSFIDRYPEKAGMIEQASSLILTYRLQQPVENEKNKNALWQRIEQSVAANEVRKSTKLFKLPTFAKIAAAILVIAVASFLLYTNYKNNAGKMLAIHTSFGEIKNITLPDQSVVTLNANSSIRYNDKQAVGKPREVWIDGEAFFSVKHINSDTTNITPTERFLVHCGEMTIEVLGTTFNVKNRNGKTDVALITGKIKINYNDETKKSQTMTMAPGDFIQYAGKKIISNKKLARPEQLTTWKENEISFTDASLEEILQVLKDRFDYKTTTKDSSLLGLKIEGDIVVNDVAELLDVVTTTLNIKIEQSANKHITISK